MEVYTLDPLLRRRDLIEDYSSAIWTERYKKTGDFEIQIASTRRSRNLLTVDTLLSMNKSLRVMKIENIEDKTTDDRQKLLVVKGRSIEASMYDRAAVAALTDTTTNPKWTISGLAPMAIARKIFHDICVTGTLSPYDVIPFINEGSFSAAGPSNIPEPTDIISIEIEPTTVYDAISQLSDIWNFGFRILREFDTSKLWFSVYTGSDRTTGQTALPAVVFSPQLDNLRDTRELISAENAKNVAYVFSPDGFQMVYADDVETDISGIDRRVLVVNATDITTEAYPVPADLTAALIRKGKEELSQARIQQAFDGEISQSSEYQPGRDYFLGDLVEQRNVDGVANNMRVSEIIYADDAEGERAYPTLELNQYINTASWLAHPYNKMWSEMTTDVWADQP